MTDIFGKEIEFLGWLGGVSANLTMPAMACSVCIRHDSQLRNSISFPGGIPVWFAGTAVGHNAVGLKCPEGSNPSAPTQVLDLPAKQLVVFVPQQKECHG